MNNNYYTSYSTSSSQFLDTNAQQPNSSEYLNRNPMKASEIIAISNQSSNVVRLPIEELQVRFVLMAAEVDRLLILNSLANKEAEHWRKKFVSGEKLTPPKDGGNDPYKQKYSELEARFEALNRSYRITSDNLTLREREVQELKRTNTFPNQGDKDREIEYWKNKATQSEAEYFNKVQNIKIQTEAALREKIEGEVKKAFQDFEREKIVLQKRISDLTAENESLLRAGKQASQDSDGAYWKEKYNGLEASIETKVKASMQGKLHEALTPLVKENEGLYQQVAFYKEKFEESQRSQFNNVLHDDWTNGRSYEQEKRGGFNNNNSDNNNVNERMQGYIERIREFEDRVEVLEKEKKSLVASIQEYEERIQGLMKDNNLLSDHLREISEKENKLYDVARAKENLEAQKQTLQDTVKRYEQKIKENEAMIKTLNGEIRRQNQEFDTEKREYENALEVVRKKLIDFEELIASVEHENERLRIQAGGSNSGEAQKLRDLLYQKENELNDWKNKYEGLEQDTQAYIEKTLGEVEVHFRERLEKEKEEYSTDIIAEKQVLENQLRAYEQKVKEMDPNKAANMNKENHQLLLVNNQLNQELKDVKSKLENLSKENNTQVKEIQRSYEQEKKTYIEKEITTLQVQLQEKMKSYEKEIENLHKVIQQYEMRQVLFFIEIERLYLVNGEFIQEINTITDEINFLANENEGLNQRLTEAYNLNDNSKYDKIKYEELISELREQVEDSQKRVQLLMVENTRLSDSAVTRLKEIENLKTSISSKANPYYESPKKSQAEITEINMKHEKEKSVLESQITQLRNAIDVNRKEMEKLQEINVQRKQENESLYQELESVKGSLWKLEKRESEVGVQKDQFEQLFKEVDEMRKARDFYKQQFEQVSAKLKDYYNGKVKDTNSSISNPK